MSNILVFGGAHIDRRGRIEGETVLGASNPGSFFEEAGGGAFNAARALARLGHRVTQFAPRGGDAAGERVEQAAAEAGVDYRPATFLDRSTPSYTALIDRNGDLVIGFADMGLYRHFAPRRLDIAAIRQAMSVADALLCDANLPQPTLTRLAQRAGERELPLYAIAISPAKIVGYRPLLDRLAMLFMNEAEARALTGENATHPEDWPVLLRKAGLKAGAVTAGGRAAMIFDETATFRLVPPAAREIGDVTGAGDAFAAGIMAARLTGLPLATAARHGVSAALIALASRFAHPPALSPDLLEEGLAAISQPEQIA